MLEKNRWGFWKFWYEGSRDLRYTRMIWTKVAGFRSFNEQLEDMDHFFETIILYYGVNAVKKLELPLELFPPGTSVHIQQSNNSYFIHLISFENQERVEFDLYQWMLDEGLVAD